MAGSLNHIIGSDGAFTMDSLDNLGDAHEALDECFKIIYFLSAGDYKKIKEACNHFHFPKPKSKMVLGGGDSL